MRKTLLDNFVTAYKLKTLRTGALVREWPRAYSLYIEDNEVEGGYSIVQNYSTEPSGVDMEEALQVSYLSYLYACINMMLNTIYVYFIIHRKHLIAKLARL
jgi:hypothetical protein